jgi:hypothetical protein
MHRWSDMHSGGQEGGLLIFLMVSTLLALMSLLSFSLMSYKIKNLFELIFIWFMFSAAYEVFFVAAAIWSRSDPLTLGNFEESYMQWLIPWRCTVCCSSLCMYMLYIHEDTIVGVHLEQIKQFNFYFLL